MKNFEHRKNICNLLITLELKVADLYEITKDKDGYNGKIIPLERSNRICQLCPGNCVEDETHFLIDCPLHVYDNERRSFFEEINRLNINFCNLDIKRKMFMVNDK